MVLSPIFVHIANLPITGTLNWILSFPCLSPHFLTFLAWEFLPNKWPASPPLSQVVLSEEHKLRQWLLCFMKAWLLTLVVYILSNNPSPLFPLSYKDLLIFFFRMSLSSSHSPPYSQDLHHIVSYCVGLLSGIPSHTIQELLQTNTTSIFLQCWLYLSFPC